MFVDEIQVYARAGHGGKGCIAFTREAFRPKGGPSGGNGGRGGSVILQADHDLNNLVAQFFQPRLLAQDGEGGKGKGMDGRAGRDLVVRVPCGTLVWHLPATPEGAVAASDDPGHQDDPEQHDRLPTANRERPILRSVGSLRALEYHSGDESLPNPVPTRFPRLDRGQRVADLTQHDQQFVLCKGGRGGLGNKNFATAARQTPRFAQPGEAGEDGAYLFELKIIADVGLVGFPNAGKSTLLSAISHARPKVAPYPFTTLHPQVGIVQYADWRRIVVCDVPGLIEGAHDNAGLGHAFLRHIERCKILVLLIDMAGTDGRQPWDDYRHLLEELGFYDPALLERPRLVVGNKMDEPVAEKHLRAFKRKITKTPVLPIAAGFDVGIDQFKKLIRDTVEMAGTP